jgi:hypothetical protein
MAEPQTADMISAGWDVYDSDGERIGDVEEVTAAWLRVAGEVGESLYVPIASVEAAAGGAVTLDTPGSEIPAMGWDRPPETAAADTAAEDRRAT